MKIILIDGRGSVHELIAKSLHIERMLGRNPNHVILSTHLASVMVRESIGVDELVDAPEWQKAIGSKFMGLKVLVTDNKDHKYIEVFEIK